MSYLNAIDPTFEARRVEIEKSIINLQQRLLRRKQLDLQIEKQMIEQESLQKTRKYESAYLLSQNRLGINRQVQQRLGYLGNFDPRAGLIKTLQQQKQQTDYLTRLRAIQIQQNIFDRQYARKREDAIYSNNFMASYGENFYPLDESGEVLANKYIDGTRALELNDELKKSTGNLHKFTNKNTELNKNQFINEDRHRLLSHKKQSNNHSTVKKYAISAKKNDDNLSDNKYQNMIDPTPIKMIENSSSRFNSTAGNFNSKENDNQNKNLTKIQQQESLQQSPILKSKGLKKSRSKSTQFTNQLAMASYLQPKSFQATLRPKSSQKNSRYQSNHHQKSLKNLCYSSGTKRYLIENQQSMQKKVRRQVQDRLRLSQQSQQILDIFYAKNVTEYLTTIYAKEDKFRKQLKEKICKFPIIQRKFDVAPVLE